jgi:Flp pilus assembly protein TadD
MLRSVLKEAMFSLRKRARATPPLNEPTLRCASAHSEDAEADCRRRVERMPNAAEAHVYLGVALKSAKKLPEAEASFRRALSLHGDNIVAHYNLGIVLAETHRPYEAEEAFRNALRLLPNFAEAYSALGLVLLQTRRFTDAEGALRRALELKPNSAEAQKNLTNVLVETKRLAEAEVECRRVLDLKPDSDYGYVELGTILIRRRRFAEAEAIFRRAIALDETNAAPVYHLAVVLAQTGRLSDAEATFQKALKLKAEYVDALGGLAAILTLTSRSEDAEAPYRRILELRPNDAEAHNGLGIVFKNTGRLEEAEAAFRRAQNLNPDLEAPRRNLDLAVKEIKRLSEVEAACRRVVKTGVDSATSQYNLGLTLIALGRLHDAEASFKKAVALEPTHADAHRHLGVIQMRQKRFDEAIVSCLRALSLKPDSTKAMVNLAVAYSSRHETQNAKIWLEKALAIDPQQVGANRAMASILFRTGSGDEAKPYHERASRRPPVYVEYAANPKRTVLLLWTKRSGNVPTMELLFPGSVNTRVNWVIESAHDEESADLPDYDLAFNAMGDPDLIGDSSGPLSRFAEKCSQPLLNRPDKVALTARDKLPTLLSGVDDIVVPTVWRFASGTDWTASVAGQLPLLVRPIDSHGGKGLVLARTVTELEQCRASQSGPVYVSRFVDFRSPDSWFRKYRMIFVDRKPYPYHLAISQNWMVHYANADMEAHPWKLEEEKIFLRDPEAVLGTRGMAAMRTIGSRIDLEYAGIDFSILPDNRVLVFEANPTMLVHPESISGPLEHKNVYVFQIQAQFEELLTAIGSRDLTHHA